MELNIQLKTYTVIISAPDHPEWASPMVTTVDAYSPAEACRRVYESRQDWPVADLVFAPVQSVVVHRQPARPDANQE